MIDNDIAFYNREKLKFNELLSKIQWTKDSLLTEVRVFIVNLRQEIINMILARKTCSI